MKTILIITTKSDISTIEAVFQNLSNEFHLIRFNIDEINENLLSIKILENNYFIKLNEYLIDLNTIDLVWYRRFSFIESTSLIDNLTKTRNYKNSTFNVYVYSEYKQTLLSILNLLRNKNSINKFSTFYNSNNKIYNLSIASKIGFKTPKTIVSNDYEQIKAFGNNNNWNIVLKTFFTFDYEEQHSKFYIPVKKINLIELEKYQNSIYFCPVFFQEYIEKNYELRIIVIGVDVFSFAIYSQEAEEAKIDFRIHDLYSLRYELIDIPDELKKMLLEYVKLQCLDFCSFDLILTPNNEYYFLESNIDGEWYWLEKVTGFNLAERFSKLIYNKAMNYAE